MICKNSFNWKQACYVRTLTAMLPRRDSPLRKASPTAISELQDDATSRHIQINNEDLRMWNSRHEVVLKEWAEQAMCYQKMHEKSHRKYSRKNIQLTLPVIVMSTITGTANFSLASFSEEWRRNLPILIGATNIMAGMITTIAQYLRVSEKAEGHRVAALAYGKMARNIGSELNLPRLERSTGGLPLLRACRNEMDRLEEQSPDIGDDIVKKFEKMHGQVAMSRPSIVDITPVTIYSSESGDGYAVFKKAKRPRPATTTATNEDEKDDMNDGSPFKIGKGDLVV